MENAVLKVQMLGEFSIACGDVKVNETATRSYRIWVLLAYLIYNRRRVVSAEELLDLLWGNEKTDNPKGALKTTLWRCRSMLKPLEAAVGRELITSKGGGYGWNPEVAIELDAETFERLCRDGNEEKDQEGKLEHFRKALALYRGDFLNNLSAEAWLESLVAYYHNLYINTVLETVPLMETMSYAREAERVCRNAIKLAPYQERLYQYLMSSLLELGDYKQASAVYEEMQNIWSVELGIMPDHESQAIYHEIVRNLEGNYFSPDQIREQLREKEPMTGALICDYTSFKLFYQAEARSAVRRGDAIHIGVFTVEGKDGRELSRRSLNRVMELLRIQIQEGLRRGDIVARCSASQYVLMLLQANYENSQMVCERIIRIYAQTYPHSPAQIRFYVLPLEPLSAFSESDSPRSF